MKVEFFRHNIDQADIDRTVGVLHSIFLTTGAQVAEFEKNLASYLGVSHAVGVTSCTAALHLCLLAWGIGEGDEVITTPMTFCATSNSVMHAGATPVFCDVEKGTGNIDASRIEEKITPQTRAIMPVHLYGQMCDMKAIRAIADRHKLVVIEDAAHCIEGIRDGVRPGQLGDAACFSFYATKNITSGEGGGIATKHADKAVLLQMLRSHGIDRTAADRYTKKYKHWEMPILGWKYNMDNIQGALLIGQLKRIDALWEKRDSIARRYEEAFRDVPGLELHATVADSRHPRHLFTVLAEDGRRDDILLALQERGVGVAVNYRAVHLLEYYRKNFGFKEGDFPVAENIGRRTLSIPLYPSLTNEEIGYVIESVRAAVSKG